MSTLWATMRICPAARANDSRFARLGIPPTQRSSLVLSIPNSNTLPGFAIHDDKIYLASQSNQRLLVVDAADKSALRLLGSVHLGASQEGVLYKVAYRAGHCYVAHQTAKKLLVVDVRAPNRPVVVGSVAVTTENDGPFSVMLHGNYALVGTIFGSRNRLAVVDIENPAKPRLEGRRCSIRQSGR